MIIFYSYIHTYVYLKYLSSLYSHFRTQENIHSKLPLLLLKFCQEIAAGMTYLSGKQFVHRDLAARNVLISVNCICKVHPTWFYQWCKRFHHNIYRLLILECLVILLITITTLHQEGRYQWNGQLLRYVAIIYNTNWFSH